MRIISGKNKGRHIVAPKNLPVRPTTDFAKEALFSIINNYYTIQELSVLDLFSGTGNISYEFASRGAQSVTAVDASFLCVRFINKTAEKLDFDALQGLKADALQYVSKAYQKWDIIFADPPYDFESYNELIEQVFNKNLLSEDGMLIVEHGRENNFEGHPMLQEHRKYGHVHFSFFYSSSE